VNCQYFWVPGSQNRRTTYPSRLSLFCFHFPFRRKDQTGQESRGCPFFYCSSLRCVLLSHLTFSIRVRPSAFGHSLILFDLLASIPIILYYSVLTCILISYLVNQFVSPQIIALFLGPSLYPFSLFSLFPFFPFPFPGAWVHGSPHPTSHRTRPNQPINCWHIHTLLWCWKDTVFSQVYSVTVLSGKCFKKVFLTDCSFTLIRDEQELLCFKNRLNTTHKIRYSRNRSSAFFEYSVKLGTLNWLGKVSEWK